MYVRIKLRGCAMKEGIKSASAVALLCLVSWPFLAFDTLAVSAFATSRMVILCASQIVIGIKSDPVSLSTSTVTPKLFSALN